VSTDSVTSGWPLLSRAPGPTPLAIAVARLLADNALRGSIVRAVNSRSETEI
jgi:hypothetical protein